MKITQAHYEFWCQRKHQPSWYPREGAYHRPVPVHRLIPTPKAPGNDSVTHNTLEVLKMVRRKEKSVVPYLVRTIARPGSGINPRKQAAMAAKWLQKIALKQD